MKTELLKIHFHIYVADLQGRRSAVRRPAVQSVTPYLLNIVRLCPSQPTVLDLRASVAQGITLNNLVFDLYSNKISNLPHFLPLDERKTHYLLLFNAAFEIL